VENNLLRSMSEPTRRNSERKISEVGNGKTLSEEQTKALPVSNGMNPPRKTVDKRFAKDEKYHGVLSQIEKAGVCPFCPENFLWHTEPILRREGSWFITKNFRPYQNSQHHFMLISTAHKEKFSEITPEDWANLGALINWTVNEYKILGGALAMRFGETSYTGSTVCHLHAHVIVPQIENGKSKTVNFPIG